MYGAVIFEYRELERIPIHQLERPLHEKLVAMKVITGYTFDNRHVYLNNLYGELFSFALYRMHEPYQYEITVWNSRGTTHLYSRTFLVPNYNVAIPKIVLDEMYEAMENYSKGIVPCSDCGSATTKEEIGGQYFAGVYCQECWVGTTGKYQGAGGWKEIESKENYN